MSLQKNRTLWIEEALTQGQIYEEEKWTKCLAIGGLSFTEGFAKSLGMKGQNRKIELVEDTCLVKEPVTAYNPLSDGKNTSLSG